MLHLLERLRFKMRMLKLALTLRPMMGADGDEGDETPPQGDPADPPVESDKPENTEGDDNGTDWKAEARKHERRSKENYEKLKKLEARLAELEGENKSEREQALEEARAAVRNELTGTIRETRLENAVMRHAAGRFADIDDAVQLLDREGIFDDEGNLDTDAVKTALDQLLENKPHLAAKPQGTQASSPAGRGKPANTSLEELTPEDWLKKFNKS